MSIIELSRADGSDPVVAVCRQCAAGSSVGCEELLHRLLALDHSRMLPWAPLHAVVASCFWLQHADRFEPDRQLWHWVMIGVYAEGGLPALTRLAEELRRLNGHTASGPLRIPRHYRESIGPLPTRSESAPLPRCYAVTIHDVSVDGTFPAEGHARRVRTWVEATIDAWRQAA